MLDCYTLSLLSLSLILSIIIINIFIINVILEKKEKRTRWEGGFTNKTVWACLYAYYLCTNFFLLACFLVVSCKKFLCFFRLYNCVCKFDKTKDKNLLKKTNITREIFFFQNHVENDAGCLVPDLFLFLKKALYEVKASGLQLTSNHFR